ncbi:MAG: Txe/YoeB family addiction module toxin [Treponemataceae bacterium]|nr:MAG: Txe/YoeB family addiction module toxin [Treponemataceae bacterium]
MVVYTIRFSKKADKDKTFIKRSGFEKTTRELLRIVAENPYQNPPPYEKLQGKLSGKLSRRINIQHRLVYEVFEMDKTVKILSLWTHYE